MLNVAMRARDQSSIFSIGGKFRPDYGLLLELHALTLVACSYVLLQLHCSYYCYIESAYMQNLRSVEVYPIRNSASQKLQVRLVAFWTQKQPRRQSPSISFFKNVPLGGGGGGGGGYAPRPSYLLRELAFLQPRSVPPQSKKSSYVYANYNLTQAIQC